MSQTINLGSVTAYASAVEGGYQGTYSEFCTATANVAEVGELQADTMPTASADRVGQVVQYIGATGGGYTHGYFYECVNNSGTYSWENVQVSEGGGAGGHTIVNSSGTELTQRSKLKFIGATITDDSTNDQTVVTMDSTIVPVGITVTTLPTKTRYYEDETLVLSGARIDVLFSDASVRNITNDAIYSPAAGASLSKSNTTVSVSYGGFNTSFPISVAGKIYGVEWDGTSTTKWSRTDNAESFTDPSPAVNNGSGSSPFDNISPWKDMTKSERTGGTMVKIPKFYYKLSKSGNVMKLQVMSKADYDSNPSWANEGFKCSPAHMDRGDTKGERDEIYVARYHCATSTYKSTTGVQPAASATRSSFRSSIHNLGSNIWQYDYATLTTIWMLYLVEFADWNSQNVIGYGCSDSGSKQNMGLTDSMQYHTGTSAANRTTYGHVQYRNIEDLWGNVYDWCDGIYFSGANIYVIKNPANFSDTANGTLVGTRPTSSNYISAFDISSVSGFDWFMYPSAVSGSESTYICDYCSYDASGVVLCVGGNCSQSQGRGLFCLDGYYSASSSGGSIGSRLLELP